MRRFIPATATCAAALSVSLFTPSCSENGTETDNPVGPSGVEFRRSSQPYQVTANVSDSDQAALRDGNQAFALELYREVAGGAGEEENVFLGTHSITTVLTMTLAGARSATESEIVAALRTSLSPAATHPAMNDLAQRLRAATQNTTVDYNNVNSLWLAQDHQTSDGFLDVLSEHYDTGVYLVDFAEDTEGARQSINRWVGDQTQGLIPELFGPNSIEPTAAMTLTNAVYLSASWRDRFDVASTSDQDFLLPDGNAVTVPMMTRQWEYPYALGMDWRALELPFDDVDMGMVFVVPTVGDLDELESQFDQDMLQEVVAGLEAWDSEIVLADVPRFEFSSSFDLGPALMALGMTTAFDPFAADFTGIDPDGELYVDSFVHQTTVGVDENGTTAAAATGEVMVPSPITPRIELNRPFLFFIYDHETGSVLFMGRFVRPAGELHAPTVSVPSSAEKICRLLSNCFERTTTEAECLSALAADNEAGLEQCAACMQLGADQCGGLPNCDAPIGNVCEPATCSDYCPAYQF